VSSHFDTTNLIQDIVITITAIHQDKIVKYSIILFTKISSSSMFHSSVLLFQTVGSNTSHIGSAIEIRISHKIKNHTFTLKDDITSSSQAATVNQKIKITKYIKANGKNIDFAIGKIVLIT